jgi:hypothetical protein
VDKIMAKTNDISRLASFEDHNTLADNELDAMTGGTKAKGSDSWLGMLAKAIGHAAGAQAANARL